jgi:hypothetical protein
VLEAINDLCMKKKFSTEAAVVKQVKAKYPGISNHLVLEEFYKCIRMGLIQKVCYNTTLSNFI